MIASILSRIFTSTSVTYIELVWNFLPSFITSLPPSFFPSFLFSFLYLGYIAFIKWVGKFPLLLYFLSLCKIDNIYSLNRW